jgi:hypothetical protein
LSKIVQIIGLLGGFAVMTLVAAVVGAITTGWTR